MTGKHGNWHSLVNVLNFMLMKALYILSPLIITCFVACSNKNEVKTDDGAPVYGIDISHFQGTVDWEKLKKDQITFVYAKATQGITYTDPMFKNNWSRAKEAAIARGAYHFYMAADDPVKQAEHFISVVVELETGDCPPMLDLEAGGMSDGMPVEKFQKDVMKWLTTVEEKLSIKPFIYTSPSFGTTYLNNDKFSVYKLWIADYGADAPSVPPAWAETGWLIWQKTPKEKVDGIAAQTDYDVFNGIMSEFKSYQKSIKI